MQRRQALHLLAGATIAAAGCLDRSESTESPTTDDTPTSTPDDDGRTFAVESVETFTYAIRLNDLGNSPSGRVPDLTEFDDRERSVVEDAIDGGYEDDDPPEWLVKFLAETRYVLRDGTYYGLDHTLPTTEITAEAVEESAVDGEIASREAYREAVTHDGVVMDGLMQLARRDGYELTYVWPSLRAFLEEYDAVRYRGEVLDFSVTVEDPGAPYRVTAEPVAFSELADAPVWDATDAPAETREVVREAGETSGVYGFSEAPPDLLENLDASRYVYFDGTFYTAYVEKRSDLPTSLTAEFTDPDPEDGARFRLALHNDGTAEIQVRSGAPRPFGVLHFQPADDPETGYPLWTDAYEESEHVNTEGREVTAIQDIGLQTQVPPDESVEREFAVEEDLPAGEYVLADQVGIGLPDDDGGTFPYRVRFSLDG